MDGSVSDDNTDAVPDDAFSMICGDLGLGENSRSSASLRYELEVMCDSDLLSESEKQKRKSFTGAGFGLMEDVKVSNSQSRSSSFEESRTADKAATKQKSSPKDKPSKPRANSKTSTSKLGDEENGCVHDEHFPTYADVPYGTSLRQQKKLYEKNLGSILQKHTNSFDGDGLPTSGE